ncbi:hypothetical protein [Streptomyces sp. NBC_01727]|uniref:hypothetical protein n=1 Tax=Streptomyces sp. NBC_01727 TaxID=2975924 RepID=UPI002E140390|nr:transposase [Streptomyces sp. NBC_01727]
MLQFLLDLSDGQTAEAVRCRIDFKYALAMKLDAPASTTVCWPTSVTGSPRSIAPPASWTSHWPASRTPG